MARFYHGTAKAFVETVRDNGLQPPPGHGRGVRLTRSAVEARSHARAWSAYITLQKHLLAEGMIVVIEIADLQKVRVDSNDVIRAEYVRPEEVVGLRGPIKFPEFGDLELHDEPQPPFFDALAVWEDLTAQRLSVPFPRRRARRN